MSFRSDKVNIGWYKVVSSCKEVGLCGEVSRLRLFHTRTPSTPTEEVSGAVECGRQELCNVAWNLWWIMCLLVNIFFALKCFTYKQFIWLNILVVTLTIAQLFSLNCSCASIVNGVYWLIRYNLVSSDLLTS